MIMITIFILIYLVSLVIHLVFCYEDNKQHIFYVGDLLDEIEFYMWCPILNTILIIVVIIIVIIVAIIGIVLKELCEVSKLNVLWEKFRNIKLK